MNQLLCAVVLAMSLLGIIGTAVALAEESALEQQHFRRAMQHIKKNQPRSFALEARKISPSSPYQPLLNYWRGILALRKGSQEMLLSLQVHSPVAYVRRQSARHLAEHYMRRKQWHLFAQIADAGVCATMIQQLHARQKTVATQLRLMWYGDWHLNKPLCLGAYRLARQQGVLAQEDIWRKLRQLAGERLLPQTRRLLRNFKLPISYSSMRKVIRRPVTYIKGKHALQSRADRELVMIAAIAAAKFNSTVAIRRWRAFSRYFPNSHTEQVWAKLGERAAKAHRNDALALFALAPSATAHDGNSRAWHVRAALRASDYGQVARVIYSMPPSESSLTAWRYWRAVALGKIGKIAQSKKLLLQLAQDSDDYYGLLARESASLPLVPRAAITAAAPATDELNADHALALAVWRAKRGKLARRIWKAGIENATPAAALAAADAAAAAGWHLAAINVANAQPHDANAHRRRFPLPYQKVIDKYSHHFGLDRAFVYALIRRESRFTPKARSAARARGLMQVLPSTARVVARKHKYTRYTLARLTRVDTNVIIGATYLNDLARQFNNSAVEVAAAYNAGPNRAVRWQRNNSKHDILAHIENIPITETRLYVKAVLAARAHYSARLGNPPTSMRQVIKHSVRDAFSATAAQ